MKFEYQAFDAAGKSVSDRIDAADANEAMEALRRQGLYVAEIKPVAVGTVGYASASGSTRAEWAAGGC